MPIRHRALLSSAAFVAFSSSSHRFRPTIDPDLRARLAGRPGRAFLDALARRDLGAGDAVRAGRGGAALVPTSRWPSRLPRLSAGQVQLPEEVRILKPSLLDHPAIWQLPDFGQDREVVRVLAGSSKFAGMLKNPPATDKRFRPNPLDHTNRRPTLLRQAYRNGSRRATGPEASH